MNERGELNERLARSAAARAHTPGYARTLRPCGAAQARLCGDTPCGAAQAGLKGQGLKGQGRRRARIPGAAQAQERRQAGGRTNEVREETHSARKLHSRNELVPNLEVIFSDWNASPLSNQAAQGITRLLTPSKHYLNICDPVVARSNGTRAYSLMSPIGTVGRTQITSLYT
jgi:hypothetical protein